MRATLAVICAVVGVSASGHNGTCPSSTRCDASTGDDKGRPCCQVTSETYECCYSSEGCIPKVGCRCAKTGKRLPRPRTYAGYDFEAYKAEFGKSYGESEHQQRKTVFEANLNKVMEHNRQYAAGEHRWFMAVNSFADWTKEEFARLLATEHNPSQHPVVQLPRVQPNPESIDWRTKGAVTPVKDQGGCGSCWAFSAAESVESHYQIASGKLLVLSPQTYVNCVENPHECGGTGGCAGATMELAFNLTASKGIALEKDLPYQGVDGKCTAYPPAVKAAGYVKNPVNDADGLETALATKGPVSVTVAAGPWQLYGGGVFHGCSRPLVGDATLDHGVQAVGYTKDYWIIRNSWGSSWGEQGYIRLSRASDGKTFTDKRPRDGVACKPFPKTQTVGGECGILFDTSYPTGAEKAGGETVVI